MDGEKVIVSQLTNLDDVDYETGVDYPVTIERPGNLTEEDIEWAVEKGATSEDEIFRLVVEHKKELGE